MTYRESILSSCMIRLLDNFEQLNAYCTDCIENEAALTEVEMGFKEKQAKLDALTSFSSEWLELLSELKGLECEGAENGVCCKADGKLSE